MFVLGVCYETGLSCEMSVDKAVYCFRAAAKLDWIEVRLRTGEVIVSK